MITFNRLKNFLVLAEELHFAKAAERLGISQAALSTDIRKLEEETGCLLLDRSDKWNISLTASGSAYYEHVQHIPEDLEQAALAASSAARGEIGILTIRTNSSVYNHINLSEIFRKMRTKYPNLKLKIYDSVSDVAIQSLLEKKCDISFLSCNERLRQTPGLCFREMFRTPLAFVIPKKHPLAFRKNLTIRDFRDCGFILPPALETPWFDDVISKVFIETGHFQPKVVQEARGPVTTLNLAAAGFGVGILPESVPNDFPDFIVFRRIPVPVERIVSAVWLESNRSPALKNFIALLKHIHPVKKKISLI